MEMHPILLFIFNGFIGGLLYILWWAESYEDLKKFEALRHLFVGAIIGYIYYFLHSEWNFPNSVMTIVSGYFGTDVVEGLMERLRPLLKGSQTVAK